MSASPRLSVLMPVRDAAPYLDAAARSLARQSLRSFEVVAVDDGSRDSSGEILDAWARRDPRFRIIHRPPRGLVEALNEGLSLCRGELVARMDADDIAHPRRLELQTRAFENKPRPGVVSCRVRFFPAAAVARGARLYEAWLNGLLEHEEILRERFVESPIPHPTAVVWRRLLTEVGGYREGSGSGSGEEVWPEDYDLWLRLAAAGVRFTKVPQVLVCLREHPRRLTRTDPRYGVDRFLALKAQHLASGPLAGASQVILWGAGRTGRRLARHLLALGAPLTAFIDIDPAKIGRAPRGVPVRPRQALPGLLATPGRTVVLAAVASRGARALLRTELDSLGLEEGKGYWCVA